MLALDDAGAQVAALAVVAVNASRSVSRLTGRASLPRLRQPAGLTEPVAIGTRNVLRFGRRVAEMTETPSPISPLADSERFALMKCTHAIAHCGACALSHRFFELFCDRFCGRCRADLSADLRLHLRTCPDTIAHCSEAAIHNAEHLGKETQRVQDAAAVSRAESEVLRKDTARARGRALVCPVCGLDVQPGHGVSFQHGERLHLGCMENQRRERG